MEHITDYAKERTEKYLYEKVQGMNPEQREDYLNKVARVIDDMLSSQFERELGLDSDMRGWKE